eukprot:1162059-Pelagomonas_calceolata.AAC.17
MRVQSYVLLQAKPHTLTWWRTLWHGEPCCFEVPQCRKCVCTPALAVCHSSALVALVHLHCCTRKCETAVR